MRAIDPIIAMITTIEPTTSGLIANSVCWVVGVGNMVGVEYVGGAVESVDLGVGEGVGVGVGIVVGAGVGVGVVNEARGGLHTLQGL